MKIVVLFNVELFKVVIPDICNDARNVTALLNMELPLTFKTPLIVVLLLNVAARITFNVAPNVTLIKYSCTTDS